MALVYFFIGMSIALIIDITVSHKYKLEETIELLRSENGCSKEKHIMYRHKYQHGHSNGEYKGDKKMEKTSKLLFLGIFIHNIPEGMATFISTTESIQLGTIIALAIALHNIPEGISVSAPIYYCTNSKKKAFYWSFLSGISEFLGALLIGLILWPFINKYILGAMLSIVAGLMIYISLDELLPVSRSLGKEHHSILGIMIGMIVMAFTYVLILN
jgi:ZIP family zinc transporter